MKIVSYFTITGKHYSLNKIILFIITTYIIHHLIIQIVLLRGRKYESTTSMSEQYNDG